EAAGTGEGRPPLPPGAEGDLPALGAQAPAHHPEAHAGGPLSGLGPVSGGGADGLRPAVADRGWKGGPSGLPGGAPGPPGTGLGEPHADTAAPDLRREGGHPGGGGGPGGGGAGGAVAPGAPSGLLLPGGVPVRGL